MTYFNVFWSSAVEASNLILSTIIQEPVIASVTVACGVLSYYYFQVVKVPELVIKQGSEWQKFLTEQIPSLKERYWCSMWCFEARFQTIMAPLLSYFDPPLKYEREIVTLSDGGQLCLDWIIDDNSKSVNIASPVSDAKSSSSPSSSIDSGCFSESDGNSFKATITTQPILLVLPGLTGSSNSEYVKDFIRKGQKEGYKCVVFNNRGRGGVLLKTPRTYSASNCDDFLETVEQLVARYKDEKIAHNYQNSYEKNEGPMIVAVGISLGGMILGHYISDNSEVAAKRLTTAIGVSVPYNCFLGTESLEKPWLNLALNSHLAKCLVNSVIEFKYMLQDSKQWDYEYILKSRTIREFDSRFTALAFGYRDVVEYYNNASLHDKLHTVRVPYLGLSASDDPFQPRKGLPLPVASTSDHVALAITSRGGHISFLEGWKGRCWAARVSGQVLRAVMRNSALVQRIK